MSTIAPDQLPTPSHTPVHVPAPVESYAFQTAAPVATVAGPAGRSRSALVRRLTIGGVAGALVVALGVAGVGLAGGGTSADERAAAEREERRQEREDERDAEERDEQEKQTANAGNASVDFVGTYQGLFGFAPTEATVTCLESASDPVMADLQAVVDGNATTIEQYTAALTPFAQCVGDTDFDAAMINKASGVVAPSQLDTACASSILATFTEVDRLDVLVTALTDAAAYDQRVYETFVNCAF